MKFIRPLLLVGIISILSAGAVFAQAVGSIAGTVTDVNGAVVVGATVTALSATGARKQSITNAKGEYSIPALAPGKYNVKAFATNFELYDNLDVMVTAGEKHELFILLTVGGIVENVDVNQNEAISTDPAANGDATVLSKEEIENLPDDPDEMQAYLQSLVGAAAGPNGGQIYIDGFTGGQLPSKEMIREIRINSNPFSAEYDRPGSGRIEILTRPGSDKFRGSVNGNFNDESLNSRNPFALNRAPTQVRNFGGNYSGPIRKGKSSFNVDVQSRSNDGNNIINAQIVSPSFEILTYRRDVPLPQRNFSINPRFDFAINDKNTAVVRYGFRKNSSENAGLSETSLLTRAYNTDGTQHELRVTETMIINAKTVNETRFEYTDNNNYRDGDNSIPSINVPGAFTGGGASIGQSFTHNKGWEVNNFTSTSFGKNMEHSFKFGGKLGRVSIVDRAESNYAGTFTFNGFSVPPQTTNTCDIDGNNVVASIEQYRCKVMGNNSATLNPTQFTITTGNPELGVSQIEGALFVSDDWKVRQDLMVSVGLRYENQSNINSNYNLAPRIGIAWSPGAGGAKQPKFVFRGGAGIFYQRFSENQTLNAERNNGVNQLNLLVSANETDPVRKAAALLLLAQPVFTLTGVTNVPTAAQIQAVLPQSNTITRISPILSSPYTMQTVFSLDRTLTRTLSAGASFFAMRSLHQLRTRNINAPICPVAVEVGDCLSAPRPIPGFGNINQNEASGTSTRAALNLRLQANLSRKFTFRADYSLASAKSDVGGTPAYSYDLSGEFARTNQDVRHSFNFFTTVNLPWAITVMPSFNASSGTPFNITRGVDANGDGSSSERPTFAALLATCNERNLQTSFCDVSGYDPAAIVPRNFGQGDALYNVSMRVSKSFGFGKSPAARTAANTGGAGVPAGVGGGQQMIMMGPGGGGGMMRGGGGGGGFGGGGDVRRPYNLNLSIDFQNILNIVNFANPQGSLTNNRFGQSTATRSAGFGGFGAGGFGGGGGGGTSGPNRRINLSARFSW